MIHDVEQNIRDCGQSLIDNAEKIVEVCLSILRDCH